MWLIDFVLHIDVHLQTLISTYGTGVYVLLFLIIFIETGLVIMPFLPWDSLLFAAWSFAALGSLNIRTIVISLIIAAIAWDNINYYIGRYFWHKVTSLHIGKYQLVKPEHIYKTEAFFAKYGVKAIILARFIPIVRTCTPFVAGIGNMKYKTFLLFDIIWGITWISLLSFAWYFFWQQDIIKHNFEKVILGIILISILPLIIQILHWWFVKHAKKTTN